MDEDVDDTDRDKACRQQERPIALSTDEHRLLIESFAGIIWETDAKGNVTNDSPTWRAYTGQSSEQWITQGWVGAIHPDEQPKARTQWQTALKEKVPLSDDFRLQGQDNQWRWVHIQAIPILGPDGQVLKWLGIAIDNTRHKDIEEALKLSQQHLIAIFQQAEVGISELDIEGRFIRVNEKICRLLGRTEDELLQLRVTDVTFSDDIPASEQAIITLLHNGHPISLDKRYVRPDGTLVWANSSLSLLNGHTETPPTLLAVTADLTQRRRTEEALRQSEQRLRIVMESVTDHAIIICDTRNIITDWHPGAQNLFGYTEAEAIGESVAIIFTPEDQAADVPRTEAEVALREGRAADERYHIRKDGSRLYVSGVSSPLYDGAGQLIGFVKVARDLTQRQQMEEALRENHRRKDEFLALLAHELRNPMATLSNTLKILELTGGHNEHLPLEQALSIMSREVRQLVRLVDDLLDVSRINRGKIDLRKQALDFTQLVSEAVEGAQLLVEKQDRQLHVSLPSVPLPIVGDPVRLTQVVRNLLGNAGKFTKEAGQVWLTLSAEDDMALLRVRDDGIGIPADQLSRIFEMFAQVDASRTRSQGGLGLGLMLVKELVERHDGRVEAHSEGSGKGSEFVVRLPLYHQNR